MSRRSNLGKQSRRKNSIRRLFIESLEDRRVLAAYSAIVDNVDPVNFTKTGSWVSQSGTGYGSSILTGSAGSNANANWTFNVTPGTYRVAAT